MIRKGDGEGDGERWPGEGDFIADTPFEADSGEGATASAPVTVSRREALAILGAVPLAAAFDTTPAAIERALQQAAQAKEQAAPFKPKFFTAHEWRTVRILVDLIIPRDERSGSATDAGVPEFMDFMMGDRPGMQHQMRGGLRWLDNQGVDRFSKRFADLTTAQRTTILDAIAWPARASPDMSHGVAFFNYFRDLTASGFYSSRVGVKDIEYIGNVFNPGWKGCPDAANARLGVSHEVMKTRVPIQRG